MADMDSQQKRYSSIGLGLDWVRVRAEPDVGGVETQDRLHFMPLYAGIAAGAPTPGSGTDTSNRIFASRAIWRRWRLMHRQGE